MKKNLFLFQFALKEKILKFYINPTFQACHNSAFAQSNTKKSPIDEKSTKRRGMPSDYIYKVIITVLCTQERLHTAGLTAKT